MIFNNNLNAFNCLKLAVRLCCNCSSAIFAKIHRQYYCINMKLPLFMSPLLNHQSTRWERKICNTFHDSGNTSIPDGVTSNAVSCFSVNRLGSFSILDFFYNTNINKFNKYLKREYSSTADNQKRLFMPTHPQKYLEAYDDNDVTAVLSNDLLVYDDFITQEEEQNFLEEIENHLKRLKYQFDHWDAAIQGYREIERKQWREANHVIIERMRSVAFDDGDKLLPHVHVLDIAKDGYIKPHIDSERFCGDTIAGLSLLSSSVMRLVLDADHTKYADILLSQRSFYVMKNRARYDYTHEILEDQSSNFRGQHVMRDRRISVILRNVQTDDSNT